MDIIATDKRGYPHNIFLISRRKHTLWVLIRSALSVAMDIPYYLDLCINDNNNFATGSSVCKQEGK